jgi:hypothetical protein
MIEDGREGSWKTNQIISVAKLGDFCSEQFSHWQLSIWSKGRPPAKVSQLMDRSYENMSVNDRNRYECSLKQCCKLPEP